METVYMDQTGWKYQQLTQAIEDESLTSLLEEMTNIPARRTIEEQRTVEYRIGGIRRTRQYRVIRTTRPGDRTV